MYIYLQRVSLELRPQFFKSSDYKQQSNQGSKNILGKLREKFHQYGSLKGCHNQRQNQQPYANPNSPGQKIYMWKSKIFNWGSAHLTKFL